MKFTARHMLIAGAATLMASAAIPAGAFLIQAKPVADDPVMEAGRLAWERGDYAAAVKNFRTLAEKGDADAQYNLGQAYRMGRGVPADLRIAQSWYQKSAAQGHDQAQAHVGIMMYEAGKRKEAMPAIRRAAERGDARAQYVLAVELTNGDLIPRDFPRAYALMTRASSKGLAAAAKSLEKMNEFIPAPDRQKGIALARQMKDEPQLAAVSMPAPTAGRGTPRVAGRAPAADIAAVTPPTRTATRPPATAAAPAPAATVAAVPGGRWRAQLGAYGSPAAAQAQWASLSKRIGALAGLQPSYERAGAFTRLRVGPLANKAAADRVCAAAQSAGQPCFPVAP